MFELQPHEYNQWDDEPVFMCPCGSVEFEWSDYEFLDEDLGAMRWASTKTCVVCGEAVPGEIIVEDYGDDPGDEPDDDALATRPGAAGEEE